MEQSLRQKQIKEIFDEDILINIRVSELTRLRLRSLTDEGEAIQQGGINAEIESKTSDIISKINALSENKINEALALSMGMGQGSTDPQITHCLHIFNNSNLIYIILLLMNTERVKIAHKQQLLFRQNFKHLTTIYKNYYMLYHK